MPTVGLRNNWNATGEVARQTYTVTGGVPDRSYNAGTAVIAELNQVVAALILDLQAQGILL